MQSIATILHGLKTGVEENVLLQNNPNFKLSIAKNTAAI